MVALEVGHRLLDALKRAELLFGEPRTVPAVHLAPTLPPRSEAAQDYVPCRIPSADADVAAYCPATTTHVYFYDRDGNAWCRDVKTGVNEKLYGPGQDSNFPSVCHLPSADADRSICGPGTDTWTYPGENGSSVQEVATPGGGDHRIVVQPAGPMRPASAAR